MSSSAAPTAVSEGLIVLRPTQMTAILLILAATDCVPFIWGPPGISKSQIAQQSATSRNIAFADIRLSQMDPTDLRGMPHRVDEDGTTVGVAWAPPMVLPRDLEVARVRDIKPVETLISFKNHNPKGVNGIHYCKEPVITVESLTEDTTAEIVKQTPDSFIVRVVDAKGNKVSGTVHYTVTGKVEALVAFEEMNSAPLAVQQASYQLILDRRLGEYIVPDGVVMCAMGNNDTDRGLTYVMPTPLRNRFIHFQMRADFDDWNDWAATSMVHPAVIGYLTNNKGELFVFDPKNAAKAFATPRSWEFVSKILRATDVTDVGKAEMQSLINGAVGDGIGSKFAAHLEHMADLPKIEDITNGRVTELKEDQKRKVSLCYALVVSTCYELRIENDALDAAGIAPSAKDKKREDWYGRFNNVLAFWLKNFQPEIGVAGMRIILTNHQLPIARRDLLPALEKFTKEYSHLIR